MSVGKSSEAKRLRRKRRIASRTPEQREERARRARATVEAGADKLEKMFARLSS